MGSDFISIREIDNAAQEFAPIHEPTGSRKRHGGLPLKALAVTLPLIAALLAAGSPSQASTPPPLEAMDVSAVYDGLPHGGIFSAPEGYLEYSTDGGKSWSDVAPMLTDVGSAAVQVRSMDGAQATYSIEVLPAPLTVSANDAAKEPGEPDPELSASVSGLIGGDSVSCSLERESGEEPGKYEVSVGAVSFISGHEGNYALTVQNGEFNIYDPKDYSPPLEDSGKSDSSTMELSGLSGVISEDGLVISGHVHLHTPSRSSSLAFVRESDVTIRDWQPYTPADNGKAYFYIIKDYYNSETGEWAFEHIEFDSVDKLLTDGEGYVTDFDFTALDRSYSPSYDTQYYFGNTEVISSDGRQALIYMTQRPTQTGDFESIEQNGITIRGEIGYDGASFTVEGGEGLNYRLGWNRQAPLNFSGVISSDNETLSLDNLYSNESYCLYIYSGSDHKDYVAAYGFKVKSPSVEILETTADSCTVRILSAGNCKWELCLGENFKVLQSGQLINGDETLTITGLEPGTEYGISCTVPSPYGTYSSTRFFETSN